VGTLTSELLGLGDADADLTWIGIRRHQAALAVVGIGIVADWLFRSRSPIAQLLCGVALLVATVPTMDGHTIGEHVAISSRYLFRSQWSSAELIDDHGGLEIHARGHAGFRSFQ